MSDLSKKSCVPCRGGVPPLSLEEIRPLRAQVEDWELIEGHHIQKALRFPDFQAALDFVNEIGRIAEAEGHHPDICLGWGRVQIQIWTHKIDGLTESDFILAAKIDRAYEGFNRQALD